MELLILLVNNIIFKMLGWEYLFVLHTGISLQCTNQYTTLQNAFSPSKTYPTTNSQDSYKMQYFITIMLYKEL